MIKRKWAEMTRHDEIVRPDEMSVAYLAEQIYIHRHQELSTRSEVEIEN